MTREPLLLFVFLGNFLGIPKEHEQSAKAVSIEVVVEISLMLFNGLTVCNPASNRALSERAAVGFAVCF